MHTMIRAFLKTLPAVDICDIAAREAAFGGVTMAATYHPAAAYHALAALLADCNPREIEDFLRDHDLLFEYDLV